VARIFTVPAAFEFVTTKSEWTVATARILGWRERDGDGVLDDEHLKAEVSDGPFAGRVFQLQLQQLPEDIWDRCLTAGEPEDIENICSGFTPLVLVADKHPRPSRNADAWQMRDEFIRMKPTVDDVIKFLDKWGRWKSSDTELLDDVIRARARLRNELLLPPEQWLRRVPWFMGHMSRIHSYPYSKIRTEKCEFAITMATAIDFLNDVKFKKCARPDCNNPFEVKSGHGQQFCVQYCGHLVSMKRNRAKAKKARESGKTRFRKEG